MTLIGGGIRRAPFANEAEAAINRTGIARSTGGAEPSWLGLSELHRPTRVAILRAELCGFIFPVVGDIAFFSSPVLRWRGAAIRLASTIWPAMAT